MSEKKKLLLLSSDGGGGQRMVVRALQERCGSYYHLKAVNTFTDILKSFDPVQTFTFGKYVVDDLYNYLLFHRYHRAIKVLYKIGSFVFNYTQRTLEEKFHQRFVAEAPDMVVSIVPIINGPVSRAAQRCGIPFLIIQPEIDPDAYVQNMCPQDWEGAHIAVPCLTPEIEKKLANHHVPREKTSVVNMLRTEFDQQYNQLGMRIAYGIDPKAPIVLVMMGSRGSSDIIKLLEEVIHGVTERIHIIACFGDYTADMQSLIHMPKRNNIAMTLLSFSSDIARIMQASNLIVSKAGSVSVQEIIACSRPVVLDMVRTPLPWEQYNFRFIIENQFGYVMRKYTQLPVIINQFVYDKKDEMRIAEAYAKFHAQYDKDEQDVRVLIDSIVPNDHSA